MGQKGSKKGSRKEARQKNGEKMAKKWRKNGEKMAKKWRKNGEKKGLHLCNPSGCISATLLKFGSTSWIRTKDPMINSHLLYQLS